LLAVALDIDCHPGERAASESSVDALVGRGRLELDVEDVGGDELAERARRRGPPDEPR
jgi:hypothetical protein